MIIKGILAKGERLQEPALPCVLFEGPETPAGHGQEVGAGDPASLKIPLADEEGRKVELLLDKVPDL